MLGLTACSTEQAKTDTHVTSQLSAPGAPGAEPFWAYSGKTGIGTSFEQYQKGAYSDNAATGTVSITTFIPC